MIAARTGRQALRPRGRRRRHPDRRRRLRPGPASAAVHDDARPRLVAALDRRQRQHSTQRGRTGDRAADRAPRWPELAALPPTAEAALTRPRRGRRRPRQRPARGVPADRAVQGARLRLADRPRAPQPAERGDRAPAARHAVFDHPSPAALAAHLRGELTDADRATVLAELDRLEAGLAALPPDDRTRGRRRRLRALLAGLNRTPDPTAARVARRPRARPPTTRFST